MDQFLGRRSPLTIGLFGDWGSGKTSIMKMLDNKFDPVDDSLCIYFNGWLFEGYDDAKSAILNSIVVQLYEEKKDEENIKDTAQKLLQSINWMRVMRMGTKNVAMPLLKAYATGGLSLIPDVASGLVSGGEGEDAEDLIDTEKFKKGEFANIDPMDVRSFRDRFSDLIDSTGIENLTILVDDLDRCSPDRLIDNLEAIKLFLNVENTAFVIGADPRIIRHAISSRYQTSQISQEGSNKSSDNELIRDYLEKLIQVPYHLPKLSPAEVETYMVLLFSKKELDDEDYGKVVKAYKEKFKDNRYSKFGFSDVKEALSSDKLSDIYQNRLAFVASSAELITEGLKGNPRQVKRFLNAFILRKKLAEAANLEDIKDNVLVKLMILEYMRPELFKNLYEMQVSQNGAPKEIKTLEEAENIKENDLPGIDEGWKTEFITRWTEIDPPLSDIDLRDYFWIARDKLGSTLSDLSLVPPIVKKLFSDLISGINTRVEGAIDQIEDLEEDELNTLLGLLKSNIIKEPNEFKNYRPFRQLVEHKIDSSAMYLIEALEKIPPSELPPALSVMIRAVLDELEGDAKERMDKLIEDFKASGAQIGTAFEQKN